jgi:hypothetical protein
MFYAMLHVVDGFRMPRLARQHGSARPAGATRVAYAPRPAMIEGLERRELLSASVSQAAPAAALVAPAAVNQPLANPGKLAKKGVTNVIPLQITSIVADLTKGTLTANGVLGGKAFAVPILLQPGGTNAAGVPILNLEVGAINLDLLGLKVETSRICLDITAQTGPGQLLGNLLAGVANLLNGGLNLGQVLNGVGLPGRPPVNLADLTGGLTNLVNAALGQVTAPSALAGVGSSAAAAPGTVDILNLSLGPVDLNLLGLQVSLDDCEGGPVTVDITAEPGPGNLLGNLLGGLARLLDNGASNVAVANSLGRVSGAIRSLV